jgi:hypothetical protein
MLAFHLASCVSPIFIVNEGNFYNDYLVNT